MPEIAEVEAQRLKLDKYAVGLTIMRAVVTEQGGGPRNGTVDTYIQCFHMPHTPLCFLHTSPYTHRPTHITPTHIALQTSPLHTSPYTHHPTHMTGFLVDSSFF